jgi:hypothetical protein
MSLSMAEGGDAVHPFSVGFFNGGFVDANVNSVLS